MKICIIITDIRRAGGTERATVNLANMLSEQFDVHIVSLGHCGEIFFHLQDNVKLHFLELNEIPQKNSQKIQYFRNYYLCLKKVVKSISPNRIIGEGHNLSFILPLFKSWSCKVYAAEHIDYYSIPLASKLMMRLFYPYLNGVIVLSSIAQRKINSINEHVCIIPNSLPFVVEKPSLLNNNRIIMVGRFSSEKGYERIIPIAEKLSFEFPEWSICIFGTGDQRDHIIKQIENKNLKNILIQDPVKNIKEEYLKSSIFAITSYNEAMPMVIIEAQYCGLPIVGFRCEGTESLVNNAKTGFIVDSTDEFYEKLKLLILDKEKRHEIANNARDASRFYDKANIKKLWEKVIQ